MRMRIDRGAVPGKRPWALIRNVAPHIIEVW